LKISILIPIYNWGISSLAETLVREVKEHTLYGQVEIVAMDDGSKHEFKDKNRRYLKELGYIRYYERDKNLGRVKVRNYLAEKAKSKYLLFLDCDVLPDNSNFIRRYLCFIEKGKDVVCGGISYKNRIRKNQKYDFHVYLSSRTEALPVAERNRVPWRLFLTSNAMVAKEIFFENLFDERFPEYGYEDTEWAIRLSKKHQICHIDNTCSHLGLVDKEQAFGKMRNSIHNFKLLRDLHPGAFKKTRVARFAYVLENLPTPLLSILDFILRKSFLRISRVSFCYRVYQLDKAVLLALASKS